MATRWTSEVKNLLVSLIREFHGPSFEFTPVTIVSFGAAASLRAIDCFRPKADIQLRPLSPASLCTLASDYIQR